MHAEVHILISVTTRAGRKLVLFVIVGVIKPLKGGNTSISSGNGSRGMDLVLIGAFCCDEQNTKYSIIGVSTGQQRKHTVDF